MNRQENEKQHARGDTQNVNADRCISTSELNAEEDRLVKDAQRQANWKRWGPYLSERQWGTVREDYSADGDCWNYFPHDHARSRAYRWGEDGLLGICDRQCRIAFAYALWNERDPILKERLFGLTGPEGNHGEDVKELYYYLDSTPTHSYMKALYKYPQSEYPYSQLVVENRRRNRCDPEFELEDNNIFDNNAYFDVFADYCKAAPMDILCRLTVHNRGADVARIHVLPTVWLRNTWSWGCAHEGCTRDSKPMRALNAQHPNCMVIDAGSLNSYYCEFDTGDPAVFQEFLFTNNETNTNRLFDIQNVTPYVKDAFHRYVCDGDKQAVNPKQRGTKCAAHYIFELKPAESRTIRIRLYDPKRANTEPGKAFNDFDAIFKQRKDECDEFYNGLQGAMKGCQHQERNIQRQAYAGMLWNKQFYHYVVKDWLGGDQGMPQPPVDRYEGRNVDWEHLFNRDVVSMPDKWEYPWYATWDLAFHTITLSDVDNQYAKDQLLLFLREWYMHPNGQLPAYEFNFGDVNPPVHAWAVLRVYRASPLGYRDKRFLARCFQKLMLNFTWWVCRKDVHGKNVFGGGFLGLDNIGVFDRSKKLADGEDLQQADGTAWMAFYAACMLDIALELAYDDSTYEDMASKFFEHFLRIVDAMNSMDDGRGLWHEEDGFYYDHLKKADGTTMPMKIRSMVGLVPLFAVLVIEQRETEKLPDFKKRTEWFLKYRADLTKQMSFCDGKCDGKGSSNGKGARMLLAVPSRERLERVLGYLLDEEEFLAPFGVRSLSKVHASRPYVHAGDSSMRVDYTPGESTSELFGGNSNWRGPIWFCVNYLIIHSLNRYDHFFGDSLQVECPTGSGKRMRLSQVAEEIGRRLVTIFLPDENGYRPCHGRHGKLSEKYANDPAFKDLVLFHEYFHADNGCGLGASHQTGWTGLVASCINMCHKVPHGGMIEPKWILESQTRLGSTPLVKSAPAEKHADERSGVDSNEK